MLQQANNVLKNAPTRPSVKQCADHLLRDPSPFVCPVFGFCVHSAERLAWKTCDVAFAGCRQLVLGARKHVAEQLPGIEIVLYPLDRRLVDLA